MSRVTTLVKLYQSAVQEYTKNPEEWKGLLSAVARYYKRSFDNIVLVYAQRPDFTQLATFDEWHDSRINRSINKGAKGIAVIDMSNPNASFKYLFDFMDTNGSEESFRAVLKYHWELEAQYHVEVTRRFHERYGTSLDSIKACIYDYVKKTVSECLAELKDFQIRDESSILYGMPVEAVKAEYRSLLTESVLYTTLYKCGIGTEHISDDGFRNISHYNSMEMFMALGNHTVSIARVILKEIYQEIEAVKRERSAAHEDRSVNGTAISREPARDDDTGAANIERSNDRSASDREIRQAMENVYDGKASPEAESAGDGGDNQRDDFTGGQRSGGSEGGVPAESAEEVSDAGSGGNSETDSAHESIDDDGGRSHHEHRSLTHQITEQNNQTEPSMEPGKPSIDGFFVVPPRQNELSELKKESNIESEIPIWRPMEEEEHFELVDAFLIDTDWIPLTDWEPWREFLLQMYEGQMDLQERINGIKEFYLTLDRNAVIAGDEFQVQGHEDGLVFTIDSQPFFLSYDELRKRIEALLLTEHIPGIEQNELDPYAIPDEMDSAVPAPAPGGDGAEPGYLGAF